MGRVITAPGVLKNTQGQLDHLSELYQDIKDNNLKPVTITLDQMQNANGAYSHTTEDDRITEGMKAIAIEVGTPESFYDQISVTTGNGTCTVSCPDAHGNSTITVTFVHTRPIDGGEDVPESVTSNEFDVLAERIGVLSNLETLANSNLVGAVNELKGEIDESNSKIIVPGIGLWNGDINSYKTSGFGWIQTNHSSGTMPTGMSYFALLVLETGNGGIVVQIAFNLNGGSQSRTFANNVWSNWG